MDTRSPIPLRRPPLIERDRGARKPAPPEVQNIIDQALIRAKHGGALVGALTASAVYIALELLRPFL